jgi:Uncharacterized protein conserved in bacteria (DUF2252)
LVVLQRARRSDAAHPAHHIYSLNRANNGVDFYRWIGTMAFIQDNTAFEAWLHKQCDVYAPDLDYKHKRMKRDAFSFLRATFFRWAKGIEAICPELKNSAPILAVGDIHLENFGTWRDAEGRLVWGVNDFDEAAVIPYAYDLVRLATSARLARTAKDAEQSGLAPFLLLSHRHAADEILLGYREALQAPRPTLLDEQEMWLRPFVACSDEQRAKFWKAKIDPLDPEELSKALTAGFRAALPPDAAIVQTARRPKVGGGSLGRPRFVAVADWHGGRIVREAKALLASAWDWAHGNEQATPRFMDLANGRHRSPDPWLRVKDRFIFRRVSADARKVNLAQHSDTDAPAADEAKARRLLRAMGFDLGAVHAADPHQVKDITRSLDRRDPSWLHAAAKAAAEWVHDDYEAWCKVA